MATKKHRVIVSLDDFEFSTLEALRCPVISFPEDSDNKSHFSRSEVISFLLRNYKLGNK